MYEDYGAGFGATNVAGVDSSPRGGPYGSPADTQLLEQMIASMRDQQGGQGKPLLNQQGGSNLGQGNLGGLLGSGSGKGVGGVSSAGGGAVMAGL